MGVGVSGGYGGGCSDVFLWWGVVDNWGLGLVVGVVCSVGVNSRAKSWGVTSGEAAADSTNRVRVRENKIRYVLIEPCWTLLIVETREVFNLIVALGPIFSSQAKSRIWLAMVCPRVRLVWGKSR